MAKQELVTSRVVELKVTRVQEHKVTRVNELISLPQKDKDGFMAHRKPRNDKGVKRTPYGSRTNQLVTV